MENLNNIEYLGLKRVLERGTGVVLETADCALLIRDDISGAFLMACEDSEYSLSLLDRHMSEECNLLMVSDLYLGELAFKRYGFNEKLECYQVAYYGEKPQTNGKLAVRTATDNDLDLIMEHYGMISREEMACVVSRRSLYIGYCGEDFVGFIGEHLEGSMGMLYVVPDYRRRGFGLELQKYLIARTMDEGYIPFGQVEKNNLASLKLQEKIGMRRSDHPIVWMWK